jgi:DNA-binding GntR family transcriptional regulator
VSAQVATKLVHLAERFGEPSDRGVRIGLRITETTLANMIGASRENVSRAIARLQRAGELHRANGRIYLVDPDLMRRRYSWVTAEEARSVREAAALHSVTFNTDLKQDPT